MKIEEEFKVLVEEVLEMVYILYYVYFYFRKLKGI